MRRMTRILPAFLAPALHFASDGKQTCPMPQVALLSPRVQQQAAYHQASVTAELVTGARHRAVAPGGGNGPLPVVNFIDSDLFDAMKAAGVQPTTLSTDAEFLRRVSLDLTGQIPDPATFAAFVNDTTPDKRARKIDELLASDAFADRWTMWFGDLVQNVSVSNNVREFYLGRNAYYASIRDAWKSGMPYDQLVRNVIAGKGDSYTAGNANFIVRQLQNNGPIQDTFDNLAAQSGERFLGMPLLCLSCHNGLGHLELVNQYLKSKNRSDFWGMASFFSRSRAQAQKYTDPNNPNANLTKFIVTDGTTGQYQLNTTSGNKTPRQPLSNGATVVAPTYMFTGEGPRTGEAYRDAYGRILTADRQFARATVNYLWREMFGIAIVEPPNAFDLLRLDPNKLPAGQTLQPTNPKLLEDLTDLFIANGYNVRAFLRTVATSSSYQLSSYYTPATWNEGWTTLFPRHYPHRLQAEMMLDAITKATNVPASLPVTGMTAVTRAMQLPDTVEPNDRNQFGAFLDSFLRGDRDDTARGSDSSITQSLSLLNSTIVTTRVKKATANSTVAKVLASTSDPGTVADQIYLATLSRYPAQSERALAINYLNSGTLAQKAEDLQYALINKLEFLFD
ncbi:MAG TPA: DUF1549 domain-containing protein [Thermoanaerobaculia bacterium]|nr:DUF1549 domain-containing protein [Thermoanaerobaculia bacterium]